VAVHAQNLVSNGENMRSGLLYRFLKGVM